MAVNMSGINIDGETHFGLLVTPKNYATWSTANTNVTFSNGNLTATTPGSPGWDGIIATLGKSTGKWYWEISYPTSGSMGALIGIADAAPASPSAAMLGNQWTHSIGYYPGASAMYAYSSWPGVTTVGTNIGNTSTSDKWIFALDMDNKAYYFGKNGTWANSGVPTSGSAKTGAISTGFPGIVYPAMSGAGSVITANFGQNTFSYTPPAGYNAGLWA